jgi:hypothetical protein
VGRPRSRPGRSPSTGDRPRDAGGAASVTT